MNLSIHQQLLHCKYRFIDTPRNLSSHMLPRRRHGHGLLFTHVLGTLLNNTVSHPSCGFSLPCVCYISMYDRILLSKFQLFLNLYWLFFSLGKLRSRFEEQGGTYTYNASAHRRKRICSGSTCNIHISTAVVKDR